MVKQQDTEKLSKLTPEEIVEAICRLDAVDLVKIGDEAQRKGMADRLKFVLEAAIMEASIPRKLRWVLINNLYRYG